MQKLYHIKKFKDQNEDLQVGQILEFSKGKLNPLREEQMDFSGCYLEKKETVDNKIFNKYKDLSSLLNYEKLISKSQDELKEIIDLLDAYHHNSCMEKREMIMEEVRREAFSDKPSRYNCMWLTDEECIDSWIKLLYAKDGYYSINEMELDGNLFVSTDELIPNMIMKTNDIYTDAYHYWNPTPADLEKSIKREYLFEGYAKVKKKIK